MTIRAVDTNNGSAAANFREGDTMGGGNELFGVHGAALAIRSQRLALLASNIANAATPNYKARDIDFEKALDLATKGDAPSDAAKAAMGYRVPVEASLDGNTVELNTEQTAFAENAMHYRTTLSFLQGRISTVMQALKGE
jgi:flagellar basal-body rod protein FlgB